MSKTVKNTVKQDRVKYAVPRRVQDVIPIRRAWSDGIFLVDNKYSKTFHFTDINYLVASRDAKESMFLDYSELLNSLDASATHKITINKHWLNRVSFEQDVFMKPKKDKRDYFRREFNSVVLPSASSESITQEKYITVTVAKKNIEEARAFFNRVGAELSSRFAALGSRLTEVDGTQKLRILHYFYRLLLRWTRHGSEGP